MCVVTGVDKDGTVAEEISRKYNGTRAETQSFTANAFFLKLSVTLCLGPPGQAAGDRILCGIP
jgi:hypothetical protein